MQEKLLAAAAEAADYKREEVTAFWDALRVLNDITEAYQLRSRIYPDEKRTMDNLYNETKAAAREERAKGLIIKYTPGVAGQGSSFKTQRIFDSWIRQGQEFIDSGNSFDDLLDTLTTANLPKEK